MNQDSPLTHSGSLQDFLGSDARTELEKLLPGYLRERRWFGGKARDIKAVSIVEAFPISFGDEQAYITLLRVEYHDGGNQTYMLPLAFAAAEKAGQIREKSPVAVVAQAQIGGRSGILYDASSDREFAQALLKAIADNRRFTGPAGEVAAWPTEVFSRQAAGGLNRLEPKILSAEQSNTSIKYGDRFILKLYRRLEEGTNPDLEIGLFLTEKGFPYIPPLAGAMEYRRDGSEPVTLGILQGFIRNQGDAWQFTLGELAGYFDRVSSLQGDPSEIIPRRRHPLDVKDQEMPPQVKEAIGSYVDAARLLGRRTAEMHLALASGEGNPDFAPEPFTLEYQQALTGSMKGLVDQACQLLGNRIDTLPETVRARARTVVLNPEEILSHFQPLSEREIKAVRTRCHGDYHLGQVLYTGKDFVIIDFEGEPIRSLPERKQKHSPLRDVAGMLRSFHYAAYSALFEEQAANGSGGSQAQATSEDTGEDPAQVATDTSNINPAVTATATMNTGGSPVANMEALHTASPEDWADAWHVWVNGAFIDEYLKVAEQGTFLPRGRQDLQTLLDALILEKAVYELIYELNNRPTWVKIPLQGIIQLVE